MLFDFLLHFSQIDKGIDMGNVIATKNNASQDINWLLGVVRSDKKNIK